MLSKEIYLYKYHVRKLYYNVNVNQKLNKKQNYLFLSLAHSVFFL